MKRKKIKKMFLEKCFINQTEDVNENLRRMRNGAESNKVLNS